MSQAQTQDPTAVLNQTLGTVQPATPAAPPGPAAPAAPAPPTGGAPTASPGKYEEFLSICRLNEYDTVKEYPDELKKKRISFLNEKLQAAGPESEKLQLRLIREYMDQNDKTSAREGIRRLKAQKISTQTNLIANALTDVMDNNISNAITTLSKLAIEDSKNVDLLQLLADVYMLKENYYEANTVYEDLNKLNKDAFLVQLCQTTVLNVLNADGEKICLQAAKKFPASPLPQIYIGITHRERQNIDAAIAAFKKSLEVKPTEMAGTCLAEAYYLKENYAQAAVEYKKTIDFNPHSLRAIMGLGWTEIKLKDYDESLKAFGMACKLKAKTDLEIRKAFKELNAEKVPAATRFIRLADSCGN